MTVTLFHHPGAGEGEWTGEHILEALREAGFEPVYVKMGDEGWKEALDATDELAIAAGGDGTISGIVTNLGGRDLPVALLPTGSGNNISRSLGILAPLDEIIPRLKQARSGPLRLCRADGPWGSRLFVESVGLGALAHSVLELQDEKLDGDEKLIRGRDSLISAIEAQEPLDLILHIDGHAIEKPFLMVEVMNLAMVGPNLRLVPDTALKGEHLSVALLPADAKAEVVEWLSRGGQGLSPLRHLQGRHIVLEGAAQPLRLEDKSLEWDGSRVDIRTEPHRVQILRPGDRR